LRYTGVDRRRLGQLTTQRAWRRRRTMLGITAATVVVSERTLERLGLKPLARIIGYSQAEVEPKWLFLAPVKGVQKLLARIEMPIDAFDLIEINEAFAAVPLLSTLRMAGGDRERAEALRAKTNVNGGATCSESVYSVPSRRQSSSAPTSTGPRIGASNSSEPAKTSDPMIITLADARPSDAAVSAPTSAPAPRAGASRTWTASTTCTTSSRPKPSSAPPA